MLNSSFEPIELPQELPQKLYGDEIRLKQVLINLVKNALKFCAHQDIKIKVAYDTIGQKMVVHVVDQGRGISKDEKDKLF